MSDHLDFDHGNANAMTVGQLRELLASFPQDMPVVTPGFDEGGFCSASLRGFIHLKRVAHPSGDGAAFLEDQSGGVRCLVLNFNYGQR